MCAAQPGTLPVGELHVDPHKASVRLMQLAHCPRHLSSSSLVSKVSDTRHVVKAWQQGRPFHRIVAEGMGQRGAEEVWHRVANHGRCVQS